MSLSNHERVGKSLELLKTGLFPFVERELTHLFKKKARQEAERITGDDRLLAGVALKDWDAAALLKLMWNGWNEIFRNVLGHAERSLVSEIRAVRNSWAHQKAFSGDDTYRALDSIARLLAAVSAPEAGEVEKMKTEVLRLRYDEQVRAVKRKSAATTIRAKTTGKVRPWREVVNPHKDVAGGRYQQAEFAADLWQVHHGGGTSEYRDPVEFYRRTFITDSLSSLLLSSIRRLVGREGDPVVQLQTNFGGGKTHSLLALYHLFSGVKPGELTGIEPILQAAEVKTLPEAKRVVLVGNKISPGNPVKKEDGTVVRTLWGEIAWQLGGREAFERIRADDENATSPGGVLKDLFDEHSPCMILIDEWVAYARQLHDQSDLPAGSFETQFTFAQTLTECARIAKNCLVVVSLPASKKGSSPHAQADDTEVGGARGREALDRLRNVIGRMETPWRPASADEGFEIVRRRLFEPMTEQDQFVGRDTAAREFFDIYRTQHQEFPAECRNGEYERRLKAAYPIHPEVFDRLYGDWSTLLKFQRTRGVLRLMAAVIHCLWERGDQNPMIMPSNLPIDDPRVQSELTRYLSDNWVPVIEKDVDGPNSLPIRMDGEIPNLGKYSACRRVSRTIYLGSAPTPTAANLGIEDRRVRLGCVMPGESPSVFGDALRRLAGSATYLYQDGVRYWYSTQPTVTKLAEDRAEQYKRDPDAVAKEIEKRVKSDLRKTGDFERIHALPQSGQDVPDDTDARLVVLGVDHPCTKETDCQAVREAKQILEFRGNTPRLFRNTLVFAALDKTRLQDLDEAVCRYLAWDSIVREKEALNLDPHQGKQAEQQLAGADATVTARMPEAYQWLLVPVQKSAQDPVEIEKIRMNGTEALAVRASKKLKNKGHLITTFGPAVLRLEMDRVPLWRGGHVPIAQLAEDFARYPYLPRLAGPETLLDCIRSGLALLSWDQDSFAYADSFDEERERYQGLRFAQKVTIKDVNDPGLLVKPDVARAQLDAEVPAAPPPTGTGVSETGDTRDEDEPVEPKPPIKPEPPKARRFYGTAALDPERVGRDAGRIAEEVISHLSGLIGADVKITLEIEADVPGGVPENVIRIVTENSQTLKFKSHGFENE